jgi:hydrogenase maturation protease
MMTKKIKTIVLGFGNPDRGDDGVAWHVLTGIAHRFGQPLSTENIESGSIKLSAHTHLWFNLQLIPEVAEELADYQQAIFIDAHTAEIKEEIKVSKIKPEFQNSPFTHHLTAATCLSLSKTLYHKYPESILISIRGYDFSFTHSLSQKTMELAEKAIELIMEIIS